ncbi:hypothetical protein OAQ03_00780 [Flavobacteriaceae bacterium]|nr:hypothetical protein [Flavobacteriaceae bacterium]
MEEILIGSGLLVLYRIEKFLQRPEVKLNIPLEDFLEDITVWMKDMYPTRRKFPGIVISDQKSSLAGEYNYYSNEITIYMRNNRNIRSLVDTQIHETIHHIFIDTKSKQELYKRQLKEYGYWDHPGEILSFTLSKTLTERYLRTRFNKNWV